MSTIHVLLSLGSNGFHWFLVKVTHWQHPRFHAYFPSGNSYPSILGDMLSDAIGCIGFSWAASPACTELETIVLDWLGERNSEIYNLLMKFSALYKRLHY